MLGRGSLALLCAVAAAMVSVLPVGAQSSAGVSVMVDGRGDLVIVGDSGDNRVTVRAVEEESESGYAVAGAFTVEIAGGGAFDVVGVTRGLRATMKDGDDHLRIEGLPGFWNVYDEYESGDPAVFDGNVTVTMSGGDDDLGLMSVFVDRLSVNLGSGHDGLLAFDVNVSRQVNGVRRFGDVVVRGGSGEDSVGLEYLWGIDRLDVDLGPGTGHLDMFTSGANKTVISSESSDDVITISDSSLGFAPLITTGPGHDQVTLCRNGGPGFSCDSGSNRFLQFPTWSGKLQILTGSGDDRVIVSGQEGDTDPVRLDIATSVGNDFVQLAMEAQQLGRLEGGGGTADVLVIDDLDGHPTPKRFETITEAP